MCAEIIGLLTEPLRKAKGVVCQHLVLSGQQSKFIMSHSVYYYRRIGKPKYRVVQYFY